MVFVCGEIKILGIIQVRGGCLKNFSQIRQYPPFFAMSLVLVNSHAGWDVDAFSFPGNVYVHCVKLAVKHIPGFLIVDCGIEQNNDGFGVHLLFDHINKDGFPSVSDFQIGD